MPRTMTGERKQALFSFYYLCRFNREVALALGAKAERGDKAAAALVVRCQRTAPIRWLYRTTNDLIW
ncbi:MAG: hypothetical protein ACREEZ_03465, partial [Stellaceae bacterium]